MILIPNWRNAWRMFSIQAYGLSLAAIGAWQALPEEMRASAPEWLPATMLVLIQISGVVGRLIDQGIETGSKESQ